MIRLLATVRMWMARRGPRTTLADAAGVAFVAVTHPRRRPWDDDEDLGPDIPTPRAPTD